MSKLKKELIDLPQNRSAPMKEVNMFALVWTSPLPRKKSADTKGSGGWRDGQIELKDVKVNFETLS